MHPLFNHTNNGTDKFEYDPKDKSNLILELFGHDFHDRVKDFSFALVYFDDFDQLNEQIFEFEKAADLVKKIDIEHLSLAFVKVNCKHETDLCGESNVKAYPTVQFFNRGLYSNTYAGPYTPEDLSNYVYTQVAHKHMSHIFDDEL